MIKPELSHLIWNINCFLERVRTNKSKEETARERLRKKFPGDSSSVYIFFQGGQSRDREDLKYKERHRAREAKEK